MSSMGSIYVIHRAKQTEDDTECVNTKKSSTDSKKKVRAVRLC